MKHIRKHFKRLHKVRVHENRWLMWAISLSIIMFIGLIGYINISSYKFDTDMADPAYLSRHGSVYKDAQRGFLLNHPRSWGVEAEAPNIINFIDPYNFGKSITVGLYAPADEAALRKSFVVEKETKVTLSGVDTVQLQVVAGIEKKKVILVEHLGTLYMISGNSEWFGGIVRTFVFLEKG